VLINLVGLLKESGRQRFDSIHSFGAEQVALAAAAHGARMVHVSAIGADEQSPAAYARSKAVAERLVLAAQPQAVIMRPSILFGPEDDFFNRFAALARISPVLPLIGGGQTKFQPAFVGDVAKAIAKAVDGKLRGGTTYELGGPEVRTFKELMQFMLATIERRRLLVPLPFFAARFQALFLEFAPSPLTLTPGQVDLLRTDNVVSDAAKADKRTFAGIGIEPETLEAIVPSYLWRFRKAGQFRSRVA
jgi:NADH dehydrogenase